MEGNEFFFDVSSFFCVGGEVHFGGAFRAESPRPVHTK